MPRLTVHARRALVQERRRQILAAAATVFAEKGFDRATIRDVARAAGMADGSIYNYFRGKQDLLVHLPRQFLQPPIEAMRAASDTDQPIAPEALLQNIAQNMVNILTHNREIARVLFTTVPLMNDKLRAEYMKQVPLYAFDVLEKYIAAQQAAGTFRADLDAELAARAFPGMMLFFLLVQEILQPPNMPRFNYARLLPQVVELFLRGVMVPPKPKRAPRKKAKRKAARKLVGHGKAVQAQESRSRKS